MKDPRLRYGAAITVLILAGLSAFAIGRYAVSEDTAAIAQEGSEGTPQPGETPGIIYLASPHPDVIAMETAIAEDNAKPLFTGTLNGITFIGEGTPFPSSGESVDCPTGAFQTLVSEEARLAADDSELSFRATVLPSGLALIEDSVRLCEDEVLRIGRVYSDNADEDTRRLSIVRSRRAPVYPALAPRDRLESATIGDRDAVVVRSIPGINRTRIIMRDEQGTIWTVIAERIDEDEAVEIAEGIK